MGRRTHRECSACGVVASRTASRAPARWCGACGERLTDRAPGDGPDADDGRDHTATARQRIVRRSVAVAASVVAGAVIVLGAGTAGDRLRAASTADLDVGLDPAEVADAVTTPVTEDGPVCLRVPSCVAWVEPATVAGRTPTATVADDLTLVRVRDGLEARDTRDGDLRWRTPLSDADARREHLPVVAAGDLALLTDPVDDRSHLVAVDLDTGAFRWTLHDIAEVASVRDHGEVLLAQVTLPRDIGPVGTADSPTEAPPASFRQNPRQQVVAIDVTSGQVRWRADADLFHLVPEGTVVVGDGQVGVLDTSGEAVWSRPLDDDFRPAWLDVTGRFLRLFDGRGRGGPVWALSDGAVFEHDGELVPVADLDAEPRDPFRSGVAALLERRPDGGTDLTLLDGDETAWQVTFEQLGCCAPIQVDDDRIAVPASDGGRWLLSREDGSVLDRTPPPGTRSGASAFLPSYGGFTVEELDAAAATTSDLALVEDGRRTARLPAGTWPVGATDEVVVVRSHAWVAGIHRDSAPDEDPSE